MKKIIVLGASTSSVSINRQLARFASGLLDGVELEEVDINDYEMPIYSIDREKNNGFPQPAHDFLSLFAEYDGLILSTAEHNRNICAGFKNILDWVSRIELNIFREKPVLLMSTSPGGYGGQNARKYGETVMPLLKGDVVSTFSLPKFKDNFSDGRITNADMLKELETAVDVFRKRI